MRCKPQKSGIHQCQRTLRTSVSCDLGTSSGCWCARTARCRAVSAHENKDHDKLNQQSSAPLTLCCKPCACRLPSLLQHTTAIRSSEKQRDKSYNSDRSPDAQLVATRTPRTMPYTAVAARNPKRAHRARTNIVHQEHALFQYQALPVSGLLFASRTCDCLVRACAKPRGFLEVSKGAVQTRRALALHDAVHACGTKLQYTNR